MMALRALRGGAANTNLSRSSVSAGCPSGANSAQHRRVSSSSPEPSSGVAGKTLRLQLFDIGDAQGNGRPDHPASDGLQRRRGRFANCAGPSARGRVSGWSRGARRRPCANCSTTSTTGTRTPRRGHVLQRQGAHVPGADAQGLHLRRRRPERVLDQIEYTFPSPRTTSPPGRRRSRATRSASSSRSAARRQTQDAKRPAGPRKGGALRRAVRLRCGGSAATESLAQAAARPIALRAPGQLGGHEHSGSDHAGRARRAGHRNQLLVNAGCVGRRGDPLNR